MRSRGLLQSPEAEIDNYLPQVYYRWQENQYQAKKESTMIRFVHIFNYAEGVSKEDGEKWYLGTHVPEARKLPGLVAYRSWSGIVSGVPYPSPGSPTPRDQYVRRSELCFEDVDSALQALKGNAALWAPSVAGTPGFREFECMLLGEEPEYNLLQDAPPQHYKYMPLQLEWPKGPPEVDDTAEIFVLSYCLSYSPDVTFAQGEDWYLGHHTREGKQLPGMKHYRTWRTRHVAEDLPAPLDLNKWARLTELGMSPAAFIATMVNDETRIRFTQSPYGRVMGGWLNIDLKLGQVQDLMTG